MIDINLLPRSRRHANERRRAVRWWGLSATLWCAVLAAGQAIAVSSGALTDLEPLDRELSTLGEERSRLDGEITTLRQAIDRGTKSLTAARAVIDHPDWSSLLARVVEARPQGLVFRRWALVNGAKSSLLLRIEGNVPTLGGLTAFALGLESLKVFRSVSIVTAQAADVRDGESIDRSIQYVIEATLVPPTESPASTAAGAAP